MSFCVRLTNKHGIFSGNFGYSLAKNSRLPLISIFFLMEFTTQFLRQKTTFPMCLQRCKNLGILEINVLFRKWQTFLRNEIFSFTPFFTLQTFIFSLNICLYVIKRGLLSRRPALPLGFLEDIQNFFLF